MRLQLIHRSVWKKTDMLTILKLPIHEYSVYFYVALLLFLSTMFGSSQCLAVTHFLTDLPISLYAILNGLHFQFLIVCHYTGKIS